MLEEEITNVTKVLEKQFHSLKRLRVGLLLCCIAVHLFIVSLVWASITTNNFIGAGIIISVWPILIFQSIRLWKFKL